MFQNVLIIGAGTMGLSVAALFASKGLSLTVLVRDIENISEVYDNFKKRLSRIIRFNQIDDSISGLLKNVRFLSVLNSNEKFDFVFEAVFEDISCKKSVIAKFSHYVTNETIWVTNTSSLSINEMVSEYSYPPNFIGLHFFNPVASMELVEIIPSMLTNENTIKTCWEFCLKLDKKPIRVKDSPGFIVNRLLIPMINEAIAILESNVAGVEEIDSAMTLGAHHPLGPLALADLIGNDVCLSIMNTIYAATSDSKYRPSHLLQEMVTANKLGRKSGKGFYSY